MILGYLGHSHLFVVCNDVMRLGWFILHIKGSQVKVQIRCTSVPKDSLFVLANSIYPDKMPHFVPFHLGLHCLFIVILTKPF